jgi:hypothetical protein
MQYKETFSFELIEKRIIPLSPYLFVQLPATTETNSCIHRFVNVVPYKPTPDFI